MSTKYSNYTRWGQWFAASNKHFHHSPELMSLMSILILKKNIICVYTGKFQKAGNKLAKCTKRKIPFPFNCWSWYKFSDCLFLFRIFVLSDFKNIGIFYFFFNCRSWYKVGRVAEWEAAALSSIGVKTFPFHLLINVSP